MSDRSVHDATARASQRRVEPLTREQLKELALKRPDAWWTVLVIDPIVIRILPLLLRQRWVTPNRVTVLAACYGVGAVVAFLTGHLVLGALCFEARFFLDCVDGKLARIRRSANERGALLDMTLDVVLITSAMAALGWHLAPGAHHGAGADVVPIGLSALTVLLCFTLFWLIGWDLSHPPTVPRRARTPGRRLMAKHRLNRLPQTVEVETMLLFLAPLTGNAHLLRLAFGLALAYFAAASVNLFIRLYRTSAPAVPVTSPSTGAPSEPGA